MKRILCVVVVLACAVIHSLAATEPPQNEEDLRREQAIAEFTAKMKEANYPALFEQAAKEFNVPADILKGVAFAETRWEHLKWPPGETASPDTGMPRPYGIMSLWDNEYFGHSLVEAAALIGKTTDELKEDPLQNIRGGAALLRQLYDANPKPAETTEADIESWRYAIRKYCGIPEPDLNARHALDVYTFMSKGYHQYGIEWNARPVNLEPIREETRRIVAEEEAKHAAERAANPDMADKPMPQLAASTLTGAEEPMPRPTNAPAASATAPVAVVPPVTAGSWNPWWIILAVVAVLVGSFLIKRLLSRSGSA